MKNSKLSIADLALIGLCTAIIAVMSQISIPMPLGVPMTMQTFAVTLTAIILGSKKGAVASLAYLLLGAVGVPVFAGFSGGLQMLADPTGGFLWSFPLMAFLIGLGAEEYHRSRMFFILCQTVGVLLNFAAGTLFFCLITGSPATAGLTACVLPFIPVTIIKAVLASIMGLRIKERLVHTAWS